MATPSTARVRKHRAKYRKEPTPVVRFAATCIRDGQDLAGRQTKYCSAKCRKLYLGAAEKRRQRETALLNDPLYIARLEVEAERQQYLAAKMAAGG